VRRLVPDGQTRIALASPNAALQLLLWNADIAEAGGQMLGRPIEIMNHEWTARMFEDDGPRACASSSADSASSHRPSQPNAQARICQAEASSGSIRPPPPRPVPSAAGGRSRCTDQFLRRGSGLDQESRRHSADSAAAKRVLSQVRGRGGQLCVPAVQGDRPVAKRFRRDAYATRRISRQGNRREIACRRANCRLSLDPSSDRATHRARPRQPIGRLANRN
jgi:hypothetical protein